MGWGHLRPPNPTQEDAKNVVEAAAQKKQDRCVSATGPSGSRCLNPAILSPQPELMIRLGGTFPQTIGPRTYAPFRSFHGHFGSTPLIPGLDHVCGWGVATTFGPDRSISHGKLSPMNLATGVSSSKSSWRDAEHRPQLRS